ncbi:kinase-like domain-containing protein [Melampsora americana]|nr:kinase-like domain-containing protein [Melampsora americana]
MTIVFLRRQPTGKVVLYNSHSNELSIHTDESDMILESASGELLYSSAPISSNEAQRSFLAPQSSACPLCHHPFKLSTANSTSFNARDAHRTTPRYTASIPNPLRALPPPERNSNEHANQAQWVDRPNETIIDASYFRLLSRTSTPQPSRPVTPPRNSKSSNPALSFSPASPMIHPDTSASSIDPDEAEELGNAYRVDGYYERFFVEELKLGRGEKGSVFLCTHVLYGHPVGHFAVKKVAVGHSGPELLKVLSEVKCLETLRHQNITQYHHAWIEKAQLSRFGPPVPVLFILMDYANGGTLDAYIETRKGAKAFKSNENQNSVGSDSHQDSEAAADAERRRQEKEQFRRRKNTHKTGLTTSAEKDESCLRSNTASQHAQNMNQPDALHESCQSTNINGEAGLAIHLFGLEEILSFLRDTCNGLAFLHSQGILHHDLKTENVLLHWEHQDSMIPKALISDFGSSIDQSENRRRQRNWVPPESLKKDPRTGQLYEVTQTGDMWQLGLVLHCLCFFRLPYTESDDIDRLLEEIQRYPGYILPQNSRDQFSINSQSINSHLPPADRLDLPRPLMKLLAGLLCLDPSLRPSCTTVLKCIESIRQSILVPANGVSLAPNSLKRKTTSKNDVRSSSGNTDLNVCNLNPAINSPGDESSQLMVLKRRGYLNSAEEEGGLDTAGGHEEVYAKNANLYHSRASKNKSSSRSRTFAEESRIRNPSMLSVRSSFQFRIQVYIGCLVIIKSAFILAKMSTFLDGTSGTLMLTVINVLELTLCNWAITIFITLTEMILLIIFWS